ncbi:heptaprenyl diphosphate synthase component 1 [Alkalibacillus silvisoli]|uniref:Heptaprenyl diphosphate synthase n=1 Tax=Alkalibacillus silvisoli TaxID=392823 RepID=A0ABP3JPY5_9BACI
MKVNAQHIDNFKENFLKQYKHPYISNDIYEKVFIEEYMYLIYEAANNYNQVIADALINMQISLNVHDLVDQHFSDQASSGHLKQNQLKVLLGDYHSSLFYKLLSNERLTEALYHFLPYIKQINEMKVDLLHNDFPPNKWVDNVLLVYTNLLKGIASYYNIARFEELWLPKVESKILNIYKQLPWFIELKNHDQSQLEKVIELRKQ